VLWLPDIYLASTPVDLFRSNGNPRSAEPHGSGHEPEGARKQTLFVDNLLVRIHFIFEVIEWTGLAPWEFEFPGV